jgi:hypothetical protein
MGQAFWISPAISDSGFTKYRPIINLYHFLPKQTDICYMDALIIFHRVHNYPAIELTWSDLNGCGIFGARRCGRVQASCDMRVTLALEGDEPRCFSLRIWYRKSNYLIT